MYPFGYTFIFTASETVRLRVGRLPTPTGGKEFYILPFNEPHPLSQPVRAASSPIGEPRKNTYKIEVEKP